MKMCNVKRCHGQTYDKNILKKPFSIPESEVGAEKEKQSSARL